MPRNRQLRDGHAQLFREERDLDDENPRAQMLVREDLLRGAAEEELESALRVEDVPDADEAQDGVQGT